MEDFISALSRQKKIVNTTYSQLRDLPPEKFFPIFSMILEYYCYDNDMDIMETWKTLTEIADSVQNIYGRLKRNDD